MTQMRYRGQHELRLAQEAKWNPKAYFKHVQSNGKLKAADDNALNESEDQAVSPECKE